MRFLILPPDISPSLFVLETLKIKWNEIVITSEIMNHFDGREDLGVSGQSLLSIKLINQSILDLTLNMKEVAAMN